MKSDPAALMLNETFSQIPRILHADDNASVCGAMARLLERSGYLVTTVSNGLQAWQAINEETFDLLITDNDMPYLSGVELVLKIRQCGLKLPVIIASSPFELFTSPDDPYWHNIKMLPKPFSFQSLETVIKVCLNPGCLDTE